MSKTRRARLKAERAGRLNPETSRIRWTRKPQTQIVNNKKAEQRRTLCRRGGIDDGAVCVLTNPRVTHAPGAAQYLRSFPGLICC
ncbi:hypothetical protein PAE9249_04730 [Paenibacillus sp. CECT 9249]|nr:hypothetical protein PAE9249_04730 [Paenibacillus sp. CECT 9249]